MTLQEVLQDLSLEVRSSEEGLKNRVTGAYVSDLLSDVMSRSKEGDLWITLQTHVNIVAIASLKKLSGIVIVNNRQVPEETLKKAGEEKVTILSSPLPAFETAGRIYNLLNRD